jgi:prephenate dehydrogenase
MAQKIAIVGLGLVGGSIGMALRNWVAKNAERSGLQITGFNRSYERRREAERRGAVDKAYGNLASAVVDADLVVISVPVLAAREVLEEVAPLLAPGTVVTDTCSTKGKLMQWARELLPTTVQFVGGHPMAGGTGSIESARGDLFEKHPYAVVAPTNADQQAVSRVLWLVEAIGSEPYFVDADEHDVYVGAISHLPYLLSVGLMKQVSEGPGWAEISKFASTGFRDVSRLASGDPTMHRDICITNRETILRWLDGYLDTLRGLRDDLSNEQLDTESLFDTFSQAKQARDAWWDGVPVRKELDQEMSEITREATSGGMRRLFLGSLGQRSGPKSKP